MPKPRKALISLESTPYYHCVSRCVRRAFLCGEDPQSGHSYEHRREWIEQRLFELTRWFAIDICAFAVMNNHSHVVLHVDADQARTWSCREVVERWHGLFSGTPLSQRYLRGDLLCAAESQQVEALAETWRERLMSVSWFMRCLNEHIARLANAEDGCTGRFWEGRFKCQALLDEAALLACMAYVDLNPVRAGMAKTPEASDHTSVQRRIRALKDRSTPPVPLKTSQPPQPSELMPFVGNPRQEMPKGLAFQLEDYLDLVDWSGRCIREEKRGAIPTDLPPILERLQISSTSWLSLTTRFESLLKSLVGQADLVQQASEQLGQRWVHGLTACRQLFTT